MAQALRNGRQERAAALVGPQLREQITERFARLRAGALEYRTYDLLRDSAKRRPEAYEPSPITRFFEGGRVSQTLDGVSKTLVDSK